MRHQKAPTTQVWVMAWCLKKPDQYIKIFLAIDRD